jgi:hypothetical protein
MSMKKTAKNELEKATKTERKSILKPVGTPKGDTEVSTEIKPDTNTSTDRYPIGHKVENKQTSIYLDEDVIAMIDVLSKDKNKAKSHLINEMLVEAFGLQKRSNSIIIEQ